MANRLKVAEHNAILGMDRETVARHMKAARGDPPDSNAAISITGSLTQAGTGPRDPNAAIPIPGSAGQRSRWEPFRAVTLAQLELGLTARRIWQDLKAEYGFEGSCQSAPCHAKTTSDLVTAKSGDSVGWRPG